MFMRGGIPFHIKNFPACRFSFVESFPIKTGGPFLNYQKTILIQKTNLRDSLVYKEKITNEQKQQ